MAEYFASLTSVEKLFAMCAALGGLVFLIRTVLTLVGGLDDVDADFDGDVDTEAFAGDSDSSFTILSIQGITGFFMMFGLVGLALSKQSGLGTPIAIVGGVVSGIATMWVVGRIFLGMKRLQSDGTLRVQNAIGREGEVYLTIPAGGTGKVRVVVQEQLRIFDAVSADKDAIKTGDRILVIDVVDGNVLVVAKAAA